MFSLQPSWMWCFVVLLFSVCILTAGLSVLLSPTQVVTGHVYICETSLFLTYLYLCSSYFCYFSNKAHALSQNKGRMFLWNIGTQCCTALHHIYRNYFSAAVRTSNLTKQNHVVETADAICTFIFLSLYNYLPAYAWLTTLMWRCLVKQTIKIHQCNRASLPSVGWAHATWWAV